jgi:hypothetical protein
MMNNFNTGSSSWLNSENPTWSLKAPPKAATGLTFNLVVLSEFGGEKSMFLVPKSFKMWASEAWKHIPANHNLGSASLPAHVVADFVPLLQPNETLPLIDLTIGSAENDAYLALMDCVEVFRHYSEVMEYATQNGWRVDDRNGFEGYLY